MSIPIEGYDVAVETHLYSFALHLTQLHELLLAHISVVFDRATLMSALQGFEVGVGVVGVVRRRNVFAGAHGGHTALILFHMVEFFVG